MSRVCELQGSLFLRLRVLGVFYGFRASDFDPSSCDEIVRVVSYDTCIG